MKTKLLLTVALLATVRAETSPADATAIAAEAERGIERGYLRASESTIAAAVKPLDAALAADPKNPALLYERAFAHYAATSSLRAKSDKDAIIAALEKSISLLERVKGQPWETEAVALHGCILGNLIGVKGGMSGMTLGPKSGALLGRAEKAQPNNPRVLLFRAISLLNTPASFGGDPVKGAALLEQASGLFAKADVTTPGPHWGRADALAWSGIAKEKAGDVAGARIAWEQALALEPDYGWVKFALLPSLDQKKKK